MPSNTMFYSVCLLLVALTWRVTLGSPVPTQALSNDDLKQCAKYAKELLTRLNDVLDIEDLFHGFNCTEQDAKVNSNTQTVSACQPNTVSDMSCSSQRNTPFSETECLTNIEADLRDYLEALKVYGRQKDRLTNTVKATENFLKNCRLPGQGKSSSHMVCVLTDNAFNDRVCLCQMLKGFHVRTITINRALSYIAAGDHKK